MTGPGTEARHPTADGLQDLPDREILARLLSGQRAAAAAVEAALPALEVAAALAARTLAAGRRVGYAGAGSSGLMALADALELPGTFGIAPDRVPALFAGGAAALVRLVGLVEDMAASADGDLAAAGIGEGDALIAVSASGTTPYTLAAAEAARARGAAVVGIANRPESRLLALADVAVLLDTGPEVVAGSTRLGAATAQKIAVNLISTLAGVRLGHVHDGYMVNVVADNAKLRDRAARIVAEVSGAGEAAARAALEATGGAVKPAVLVAAGARDPDHAARLLEASGGHLGPALAGLRPRR
jgi:N-acetylmuramic acid 6-phosphate etherase